MTQEVSNTLFSLCQALIWASAALLFVVSIAAIGMTAWTAARVSGVRLPTSFQMIIGIGLLELILIGWAFSQAKRPLCEAFIFLLSGCFAATGLIALVRPRPTKTAIADLTAHARQYWPMAIQFLFYLIFVSWIMTSSLTVDDISAVTTGNADIFYYAKLADFLLREGIGTGNIPGFDLRHISHSDVFGNFVVIAWASFLFNVNKRLCRRNPLRTGSSSSCLAYDGSPHRRSLSFGDSAFSSNTAREPLPAGRRVSSVQHLCSEFPSHGARHLMNGA